MPAPPLEQLFWLLILAIPIATIARTFIYEEIFRELRDWCDRQSRTGRTLLQRKFFYMLTCEYCFSHWVTLAFLALTGFRLLIDDWRGYVIAWFALVFVANIYLNFYARLRVEITTEKKQIEKIEAEIEEVKGRDVAEPRGDQHPVSRRRSGREGARESAVR